LRLIVLLLIVLAGLALRVDHAWQGSDGNLPDSAAYERIARGLSDAGRYEQVGPGTPAHPQPASNYSPGLPLLTGSIFYLAGDDDVRLARVFLALIASLAIPIAFLIARRLAGPNAGLMAAAIIAFYPTLITDSGMLLTEPLAATLIAGTVLAILRARDQSGWFTWVVAGVLLGLTVMVRPEYLIVGLALLIALFAIEARGGIGHALRPTALMLLAGLVVLAPWTIHNTVEYERLVPLSTGGGQTLFAGSYLDSGGNPTRVSPDLLARNPRILARIERENRISGEGPESITPERVFTLLASQRLPGLSTDEALARLGREQYGDALHDDPVGLAGFLFHKANRIWLRGRSGAIESLPGRLLHWLIVLSALSGVLVLAFRRRPEFWIFASIILSVTLVGVVLVASPRRAMVLWPLVDVLAGIGLSAALELAKAGVQRRRRAFAIA